MVVKPRYETLAAIDFRAVDRDCFGFGRQPQWRSQVQFAALQPQFALVYRANALVQSAVLILTIGSRRHHQAKHWRGNPFQNA